MTNESQESIHKRLGPTLSSIKGGASFDTQFFLTSEEKDSLKRSWVCVRDCVTPGLRDAAGRSPGNLGLSCMLCLPIGPNHRPHTSARSVEVLTARHECCTGAELTLSV